MNVKTHTINGIVHDVDFTGELDGLFVPKNTSVPKIIVACKELTRTELITIIHEALHASDYNMSEEKVTRISDDIGKLLWRIGFRR